MVNKKFSWKTAGKAAILLFTMVAVSCLTTSTTFVRGASGETAILLRQGVAADLALREASFILSRHNFHIEMIQPEVGYIRTQWNYSWNVRGTTVEDYRVRVLINFNPNRTQMILNIEAERRQRGGVWQRGSDSRALATLRDDITMVIGN
ncbi:MAG: hypothetical protein FWE37_05805 [Spirochaetaceae bacterium]|nr:hypothetical protein [Spirochaetaceae bacterium]